MNPLQLQEWCDNHPEYAKYKEELRSHRQKKAKELGVSLEQYLEDIEGQHQSFMENR